jgi:THO complex subunit 4
VPAAKALQLPPQIGQGSKIIVSNLPPDVTENQIRELFYTTVGQVTRVILSYDSRGASKGTAQVEFKRNEDATKAFQQYNKVKAQFLPSQPPCLFRTRLSNLGN